ncbi:Protein of unknown function [Pasteurella testudinis DSM 23072]|uniref:DUF3577 domain-containing protein n=1 Tax=Pasteurella testudinis DSM 23072 TaxID=1122938 RepID=A0A1W1UVI2_9PAST|nr:STY4534 family ICE replication protein [Pasteurella testudinis]SMB85092.1 Protein of unknown function [Pasteurella testudinis DSM 23072]SUB52111.1 Protein of uncharacterised function (DUF3577) [Pasteurella testudinis]
MTTQTKYFDLHTHGIGYLSNIREVTPKKGKPFLSCDITAISGSSDAIQYTKFGCNVVGAEAEKLVRKCQDAVAREDKVLISFVLGDLWYDTYPISKGERAGQTGVMLKSRLLRIKMVKVGDNIVYREEPRRTTEQPEAQQ